MAKIRVKKVAKAGPTAKPTMQPLPTPPPSVALENGARFGGSLAAFANSVKEVPRPTIVVDITEYLDAPDGQQCVLHWQNPTVTDVYKIADDARALLDKFPLWKEQLAIDVATVASCHVAPNTGDLAPGLFYAKLAASPNDTLWYALMKRLALEFPHLKENSLASIDEFIDLCIQYLNRHPDELAHLSSKTMQDLQRMADRKAAQTNL